jgi:DNA-binding response OmpR family regulator
MLTAFGSVEDRVAGLRMRVDDYLVKPFAFEDLPNRTEAPMGVGLAAGRRGVLSGP